MMTFYVGELRQKQQNSAMDWMSHYRARFSGSDRLRSADHGVK